MQLDLSSDQEFFRRTTARFLEDQVPTAKLRALRDDPVGFEHDYWRRGGELGWTSLLVSEERGGGSISGQGLVDLAVIAHEFGRHAAPGPLVTTNVVAAALSNAGGDEHAAVHRSTRTRPPRPTTAWVRSRWTSASTAPRSC